jgi:Fe-S-cluster containining protein
MNQLHAIIEKKQKLCGYCDLIWKRVRDAYPNEIACREGCGICCELQSVNRLEAYVIRSYVSGAVSASTGSATLLPASTACPFLRDDEQSCLIYEARPIICRTHGLIIHSDEFAQGHQSATCPYNFPSFHPNDFPPELTIDTDRVTKNLANLNLAFCMVSGVDVLNGAQERVSLKECYQA